MIYQISILLMLLSIGHSMEGLPARPRNPYLLGIQRLEPIDRDPNIYEDEKCCVCFQKGKVHKFPCGHSEVICADCNRDIRTNGDSVCSICQNRQKVRKNQELADQERALQQLEDTLLRKSWTVKKFNRGMAWNKEYETWISLDRKDVNEFAVVLRAERDKKHAERRILVKNIIDITIPDSEKHKVSIFTTDGPAHGPKYKIKCKTEKEAAEWLVVLQRIRTEYGVAIQQKPNNGNPPKPQPPPANSQPPPPSAPPRNPYLPETDECFMCLETKKLSELNVFTCGRTAGVDGEQMDHPDAICNQCLSQIRSKKNAECPFCGKVGTPTRSAAKPVARQIPLPSKGAIYWNRDALYFLNPIFEAEIRIDSGKDKGQTRRLFVQWTRKSNDDLHVSTYDRGGPLPVELTVMCSWRGTKEWKPFPNKYNVYADKMCHVKEQKDVVQYLKKDYVGIVQDGHGKDCYISVEMTEHVHKKYSELQIDDLSDAKFKGMSTPLYPEQHPVEWSVTLKSVVKPKQSELETFMRQQEKPFTLKQMLRKLGLLNFEQVLAQKGCDLKKLAEMESGELTKLGIAKGLGRELIGFCKRRMHEKVEFNPYRAAPEVGVAIQQRANNGDPPKPPDTVKGVLRHLGILDCLGILQAERYEFRDLPIALPQDLQEIGLTPEQARRLVTYFRPNHPAYANGQ